MKPTTRGLQSDQPQHFGYFSNFDIHLVLSSFLFICVEFFLVTKHVIGQDQYTFYDWSRLTEHGLSLIWQTTYFTKREKINASTDLKTAYLPGPDFELNFIYLLDNIWSYYYPRGIVVAKLLSMFNQAEHILYIWKQLLKI